MSAVSLGDASCVLVQRGCMSRAGAARETDEGVDSLPPWSSEVQLGDPEM